MDRDYRRIHMLMAQRPRKKERCEVSLKGSLPNEQWFLQGI
jgi:hypothetical protein